MSVESVKDFQIHEKVKECIDDARTQIEKITGKKVQDKIFLSGYSASGVFAQRFALAYPEIINRALIGGAAGTIPVPTRKIKYPIGIQDYENLFGKEFDSEEAAQKQKRASEQERKNQEMVLEQSKAELQKARSEKDQVQTLIIKYQKENANKLKKGGKVFTITAPGQ